MEFTPDLVHKFDNEIEVNILGWKTISLRLGGTVEQPCVDVDVVSLQRFSIIPSWACYLLSLTLTYT